MYSASVDDDRVVASCSWPLIDRTARARMTGMPPVVASFLTSSPIPEFRVTLSRSVYDRY